MTGKWKAFPRLAAHFTGRWQTIRHTKWRLTEEWCGKSTTKLYMHSGGGFVWKHFKNNTLYCGDSFQPATFHYGFERWGWQGRVCWGARPLLFNLSSTPWRPPPTQLPSPHALLHLPPIHGCTPVQLNSSRMNRKKWENHRFFLTPKKLCNSRGSRREMICSTKQDLPQHS